MKVLVACEESQRVCIEFRKLGHEAYSCDIEPCSGGHPEWHIQQDVIPLLNGNCEFNTVDGLTHSIDGKWDLIIAHPPCTYLSTAGNQMFSPKIRTPCQIAERIKLRQDAFDFFMKFVNAPCERICIENPQGYVNTHYRKPDQVIHPYFFAKDENDKDNYVMKRTCLWLKGLKKLEIPKPLLSKPSPVKYCKGKSLTWIEGKSPKNGKERSKTFPGIAKAIASQWCVI